MQDLKPVELAIEAVPEREELKKQTFALLDKVTLSFDWPSLVEARPLTPTLLVIPLWSAVPVYRSLGWNLLDRTDAMHIN